MADHLVAQAQSIFGADGTGGNLSVVKRFAMEKRLYELMRFPNYVYRHHLTMALCS